MAVLHQAALDVAIRVRFRAEILAVPTWHTRRLPVRQDVKEPACPVVLPAATEVVNMVINRLIDYADANGSIRIVN